MRNLKKRKKIFKLVFTFLLIFCLLSCSCLLCFAALYLPAGSSTSGNLYGTMYLSYEGLQKLVATIINQDLFSSAEMQPVLLSSFYFNYRSGGLEGVNYFFVICSPTSFTVDTSSGFWNVLTYPISSTADLYSYYFTFDENGDIGYSRLFNTVYSANVIDLSVLTLYGRYGTNSSVYSSIGVPWFSSEYSTVGFAPDDSLHFGLNDTAPGLPSWSTLYYNGITGSHDNGYSDGFTDGSASSYDSGFNDGYETGYRTGTEEGYNAGYDIGYDAGETSGYNRGHTDGYTEGSEEGYNAGYDIGYDAGETSGYNRGHSDGFTEGYETGSADGYETGYSVGHREGYDQGYPAGLVDGYNSGFTDGYETGEDVGYSNGYDIGSRDGYETGFAEGEREGYDNGRNDGYTIGHQVGFDEGWSDGYLVGYDAGSPVELDFSKAITSIPESIRLLIDTSDYNIFGINVAGFLGALLILAVVFLCVKFIMNRGN